MATSVLHSPSCSTCRTQPSVRRQRPRHSRLLPRRTAPACMQEVGICTHACDAGMCMQMGAWACILEQRQRRGLHLRVRMQRGHAHAWGHVHAYGQRGVDLRAASAARTAPPPSSSCCCCCCSSCAPSFEKDSARSNASSSSRPPAVSSSRIRWRTGLFACSVSGSINAPPVMPNDSGDLYIGMRRDA